MNNHNDQHTMPDWLLTNEKYVPQTDKDTFIDKSILSLLRILSRIKAQDSRKAARLHVNAAFKVVFTFMLLVMISVTQSTAFLLTAYVYLLVALSLLEARDILKILRVSLLMSLFTFIILLPTAFGGNTYSIIMITSKVFATITAVNILSHSTKWNAITGALKVFFVPDIFILVLDITIKYIVMLGNFSLNMLYALKLRSVGRNSSKYTSLSGIAGNMFIKSKEMAEEMYSAMECRGFTGDYRVRNRFQFTAADLGYIAVSAGMILVFFYFERA